MTAKKFHLAWFTNFVADEYYERFASGDCKPWGELHYEMRRGF